MRLQHTCRGRANVARCASVHPPGDRGLRLLTLPECIAYARTPPRPATAAYNFIGAQVGVRCWSSAGRRTASLSQRPGGLAWTQIPQRGDAWPYTVCAQPRAILEGSAPCDTQVERSETPGCILWNSKFVEFNEHRSQRGGCNVHAKGGECLCTSAP